MRPLSPVYNPGTPLLTELDRRLSEAVERYVRRERIKVRDVAEGFSQLAKLGSGGGGREPDYSKPGVPVAYAFTYFAQRVSAIALALHFVPWVDGASVLDIGSGSGAGSIAIGLAKPFPGKNIVCMEPAPAMEQFASCLSHLRSVLRYPGRARLEELDSIPEYDFELVLLSACLPYQCQDWGSTEWATRARKIIPRVRPDGVVVVIEPTAKTGLVRSFAGALVHTERFDVTMLPAAYGEPDELPLMTRRLRQRARWICRSSALTHAGRRLMPGRVTNWNRRRPDCVLIARRRR